MPSPPTHQHIMLLPKVTPATHLAKGALADQGVYLIALHPPLSLSDLVVVILIIPIIALAFLLVSP